MAVNGSNFPTKSAPQGAKVYEFGPFRLDSGQRILTCDGEPVRIKPKTFELLEFLVERSNQVVDKNELMNEVWCDSIVEDANLTVHISNLRKALAEGSDETVTIETFPKVGYRFNAEVREIRHGAVESGNRIALDATVEAVGGGPATAAVSTGDLPDVRQSKSDAEIPVVKDRWRKPVIIIAVAIILVGSGYLVTRWFSRTGSGALTMTRVPGTEQSSSIGISPNGEYIAHAISKAGKRTLTITHINSGSSVQLQPPDEALYLGLTFTKDNSYLYFVKKAGEVSSLYKIPILGGDPVKILDNIEARASFSPDGSRFAFIRKLSDVEAALMIANADGSDPHPVTTRKSPEYFSPYEISWSPDGRLIAFAAGNSTITRSLQIMGIDPGNGNEIRISDTKWSGCDGLEWLSDGTGLIAGLFETSTSPTQVWLIPYPAGEPKRITNDLNNYGSVGVMANSETIMAGQFKDHSSLWIQPEDRPELSRPVTPEKHHLFRWVRWTRDGRLLFGSNNGGNRDIWVMNADGTGERQLTDGKGANIMPVGTSDGRYIVFASSRGETGLFNLYRMDSNGGNLVQLTTDGGAWQPDLTPDGKWAFYTTGKLDGPQLQRRIWKVPTEGGEPAPFIDEPAFAPTVSPDGKFLACRFKPDDKTDWKVAIIPIDGGRPVKLLDGIQGSFLRWAPDGKGISYIQTIDAVSNVWTQPLDGGPPKQQTFFTTEAIFNFDWSRDNRLISSRFYKSRDVVLIRNFR